LKGEGERKERKRRGKEKEKEKMTKRTPSNLFEKEGRGHASEEKERNEEKKKKGSSWALSFPMRFLDVSTVDTSINY
jgi:hypothetical protein